MDTIKNINIHQDEQLVICCDTVIHIMNCYKDTWGASKFGLHQLPKESSITQSISVSFSGRPKIFCFEEQELLTDTSVCAPT